MSGTPKIVGLIAMNDCGKSLITSIFTRNIFSKVYFNLSRSGEVHLSEIVNNLPSMIKSELPNLLETYGCDLFAYPEFKEYVTKDMLISIYKELTNKPFIYVYVRPSEFEQFCDIGCYIYRDIRACWLVTSHRSIGRYQYTRGLVSHFDDYRNIEDKTSIHHIKFEDLVSNREEEILRLFNFMNVTLDNDLFLPSTKPYNDYFTMIDLLNMHEYSNRCKLVSDNELDKISKDAEEYNDLLDYKKQLRKVDMLPSTLDIDIDNYLKEIDGKRPT